MRNCEIDRYCKKIKISWFASAWDLDSQKFLNEVGNVAEKENHHPDVMFGWGYAKVKIFTHKIKGLVESDFILAAKINQIKI